jgi:hypothetical protein
MVTLFETYLQIIYFEHHTTLLYPSVIFLTSKLDNIFYRPNTSWIIVEVPNSSRYSRTKYFSISYIENLFLQYYYLIEDGT